MRRAVEGSGETFGPTSLSCLTGTHASAGTGAFTAVPLLGSSTTYTKSRRGSMRSPSMMTRNGSPGEKLYAETVARLTRDGGSDIVRRKNPLDDGADPSGANNGAVGDVGKLLLVSVTDSHVAAGRTEKVTVSFPQASNCGSLGTAIRKTAPRPRGP
jgi:hypothetical protein